MRKIKAEWIVEWFERTDGYIYVWCDNEVTLDGTFDLEELADFLNEKQKPQPKGTQRLLKKTGLG